MTDTCSIDNGGTPCDNVAMSRYDELMDLAERMDERANGKEEHGEHVSAEKDRRAAVRFRLLAQAHKKGNC